MMVELRGANRDGAVLARLAWECAGALGEERGTASGRNWARVPVTASIRPHFYWRFPPLFVNTATFHGEEDAAKRSPSRKKKKKEKKKSFI